VITEDTGQRLEFVTTITGCLAQEVSKSSVVKAIKLLNLQPHKMKNLRKYLQRTSSHKT
jgi:hypothetical protein